MSSCTITSRRIEVSFVRANRSRYNNFMCHLALSLLPWDERRWLLLETQWIWSVYHVDPTFGITDTQKLFSDKYTIQYDLRILRVRMSRQNQYLVTRVQFM